MEKWLIDVVEDALDMPDFRNFNDFLHRGFSMNKEDAFTTFELEFTPWLSVVADWLDDDKTEWIYLLQASQTGKTTLEMAYLLYVSQLAPTRLMWIQSTEEEAKQFVKERLKTYIQDYDEEAIHKRGWRIESFRVFKAIVKVAYATNEQTLRSIPAQYVIGDECAVWKHPSSLIKKRTRTYTGRRKGIFATTPPRSGEHHSWKEACSGNFYRWYVPCPICKHYQPLVMSNLKWNKKKAGSDWSFDKVKETTRYECCKCKALIEDKDKLKMVNKGKVVCVDPFNGYKEVSEKANTTKALQISSLYSTFTTWGETACNFIEAKRGGIDSLKLFITDELAEVPVDIDSREAINGEQLSAFIDKTRVSGFLVGYDLYTVGIDVQRNGELYCVLCGWKSGAIPTGHVLKADCIKWQGGAFQHKWAELLSLYGGFQNNISRIVLDSTDGMVTQDIYDFCNYVGAPFMPLKDTTTLHLKTCIKTLNPEINGKKTNRMQVVLMANSDKIKDDVVAAFQRTPGEIGAWTFPNDISIDFLKALTMEHRTTDKAGRSSWSPKYSHAPNHYFSALVYSVAAMEEFRILLQTQLKAAVNSLSMQRPRIVSQGVNIWRR